jgi:hypothetical protein
MRTLFSIFSLISATTLFFVCQKVDPPLYDGHIDNVSFSVSPCVKDSTGECSDTVGDTITVTVHRTNTRVHSVTITFDTGAGFVFNKDTAAQADLILTHVFNTAGRKPIFVQSDYFDGDIRYDTLHITIYDIPAFGKPIFTATATISRDQTPTWAWTSGGGKSHFRRNLDSDNLVSGASETDSTAWTPGSDLPDGSHTLYLQEQNRLGQWSPTAAWTIVIFTGTVAPPIVKGDSVTNDTTPTWSWKSGSDNGTRSFRYQFGSDNFSVTSSISKDSSFTPAQKLVDAQYTLYVQEQDIAGDWSIPGKFSISVDTKPPAPPIVEGPSGVTFVKKPTWTWSSGGDGGAGVYLLALDDTTWTTPALANQFTPTADLSDGPHTLSVKERDKAANWSIPGTYQITINSQKPADPFFASRLVWSSDGKPKWTWQSGLNGNGVFEIALGSDIRDTAYDTTTYEPLNVLAEGTYTFAVREKSTAGVWSNWVRDTVIVDMTPPPTPTVAGPDTLTNDNTPTWTWDSGGSGGSGYFRHRLNNEPVSKERAFTPTLKTDGAYTLYVQERDSAGNWSAEGSFAIRVDRTPPGKPAFTVSEASPAIKKCTWEWISGGGDGNGVFLCSLSTETQSLSRWTQTTLKNYSYTITGTSLTGSYTLHLKEQDNAGNWSVVNTATVEFDANKPAKPVVTVPGQTCDAYPEWTWSPGDASGKVTGSGTFKYLLKSSNSTTPIITPTETIEKSLRPSNPVTATQTATLYVMEKGTNGIWSDTASASAIITIEQTPQAPTFTSMDKTTDSLFKWTWISNTSPPGGSWEYRFRTGTAAWTAWASIVTAQFKPTTPLRIKSTTYTVEVKELSLTCRKQSNAASSTVTFLGDTTPPITPIGVSHPPSDTNKPILRWSWATGGNGGAGRYWLRLAKATMAGNSEQNDSMNASQFSYTCTSDGSYTLYVRERDAAGNWSPELKFNPVRMDMTPPPSPKMMDSCVYNGGTFVNWYLRWQTDPNQQDIYALNPTYTVCATASQEASIYGIYTNELKPESHIEVSVKDHVCVRLFSYGCITLSVQVQDKAGNLSAARTYKCYHGDNCPGATPIPISSTCSACN